MNGGIRFIYNVTDRIIRNVDLIPYYKKAHILPIEQRIFFKVCLLAYKMPKMSTLNASNRRFAYYAPESWNSLPLRLRSICNVSSFKRMLKNYLYEQLWL